MKIALIYMPFVELNYPSLALTQLKAMLHEKFGNKISCTIHYLQHDFAVLLGKQLYNFLLHELNSGLGEWFCSSLAFPHVQDNAADYFAHYYPARDADTLRLIQLLLKKRSQLPEICDNLIQTHHLAQADIVGFSSLFFQNTASLALARLLKDYRRDNITVMGGANVEYPMGNALLQQLDWLDYVFSGPALLSFPQFIGCCLAGDSAGLQKIPGLFSRQTARETAIQPENDNCYGNHPDINHLLPLDYDDFLASYEKHFPGTSVKPFLFFNTSRGCYRGEKSPCTFCAQAGSRGNQMTFTHMTKENVLLIIDSLARYTGRVKLLYATDSILASHYPAQIFKEYKSAIPLHFELNVHHLDPKQIRMLSAAGLKVTEAGIESLHSESLRLMKKGTTAARNLQFMMDCLLNDIYVAWNFLLGFPGEHAGIYEELYHALPLLTHFPPGEPTALGFERYSEYHRNPEKYNLRLVPYEFYYFTYPFPESAVFELAYHFDNLNPAEYKEGLRKWIPAILESCSRWKALWKPEEGRFPCLYISGVNQQTIVTDTRTGEEQQYRLTPEAAALLEVLRTPRTIAWLAANLQPREQLRELEGLLEKGLLFRDGSHYFNIVFPAKPPLPGFFAL